MVKAVVGANWGDEGKGKITDMLGETSDIIYNAVIFNNMTTRFILYRFGHSVKAECPKL